MRYVKKWLNESKRNTNKCVVKGKAKTRVKKKRLKKCPRTSPNTCHRILHASPASAFTLHGARSHYIMMVIKNLVLN